MYIHFSLLGVNGSGKTTTIEILLGIQYPTSGNVFINGNNIETNKTEALKCVGYCPQFDYLPEFLTVEQSIELFVNLRGIKKEKVKKVIDDFLYSFKLVRFKNTLVQNLR